MKSNKTKRKAKEEICMRKRRACLVALVMTAVMALAGCGGGSGGGTDTTDGQSSGNGGSDGELVTIRVATLAQQLSLPMYYISEQGWDEENGFKLEITTFSQGTGINEALGSGLVDVCTIGAAGINSCSVYDAVYLFSHEDSAAGQNCYVRKDSAIAKETGYLEDYPDVLGSPETIKGATILLPMGTGNQAEIDTYLELLGLTEEDVSLVNMDTAPAYQAFVSGEGDMCMTAYPTADEFDPDEYVLAFSMNSIDFPYYDNIIVSREFFDNEANHDALVNLSTQILRAAQAFQDDELLMDVMMEWYELNGQNVDEESVAHQTLERPFFTYEDFNSVDTTASFRNMAEFYASIGNISDEDLERVFANMDDTIIQEALQLYEETYLQTTDES